MRCMYMYLTCMQLPSDGDMEDLNFLIPRTQINPEWRSRGNGYRCSSLVKLAPGNSDIVSAWRGVAWRGMCARDEWHENA